MAKQNTLDVSTLSNEQLALLVAQAENQVIGGTSAARAGATARSYVTGGAGAVFDFFKGLTIGIKTPEQERAELMARLAKVQGGAA